VLELSESGLTVGSTHSVKHFGWAESEGSQLFFVSAAL
jgi:hypothetical protein